MKVSFANAAMAQNVSQKCEDRKRLLKAKIKNAESITNEIDRASAVELYKDLTKCNHSLLSHCQNTKFDLAPTCDRLVATGIRLTDEISNLKSSCRVLEEKVETLEENEKILKYNEYLQVFLSQEVKRLDTDCCQNWSQFSKHHLQSEYAKFREICGKGRRYLFDWNNTEHIIIASQNQLTYICAFREAMLGTLQADELNLLLNSKANRIEIAHATNIYFDKHENIVDMNVLDINIQALELDDRPAVPKQPFLKILQNIKNSPEQR